MAVSSNLKRLRKAKGLTQSQLAEVSSVSQQAISFIENERNTPGEGTLRLLASALDCTVSELIGEESSERKGYTRAEARLLAIVQRLNSLGMEKVIEYAADLAENEKYTQEGSAASAV